MRRRARQYAVQFLYQHDVGGTLSADPARWQTEALNNELDGFLAAFDTNEKIDRDLCTRLVAGVLQHLNDLDAHLNGISEHWCVERMGKVDRNVLRLAVFELLYCPDIPAKVSINEAIEIAKRYSGQDTASFINGVLDKIHKNDSDGGTRDTAAPAED